MAADGNRTHVDGTATDVARRGADGCWRYVIDNPFGIADTATSTWTMHTEPDSREYGTV